MTEKDDGERPLQPSFSIEIRNTAMPAALETVIDQIDPELVVAGGAQTRAERMLVRHITEVDTATGRETPVEYYLNAALERTWVGGDRRDIFVVGQMTTRPISEIPAFAQKEWQAYLASRKHGGIGLVRLTEVRSYSVDLPDGTLNALHELTVTVNGYPMVTLAIDRLAAPTLANRAVGVAAPGTSGELAVMVNEAFGDIDMAAEFAALDEQQRRHRLAAEYTRAIFTILEQMHIPLPEAARQRAIDAVA